MKGLTSRQKAVLDVISNVMEERGYPPTIREIGERLGIRSTNGVNDHLKALERKGYLHREKSKSRAIRLARAEPNLATAEIIQGPWGDGSGSALPDGMIEVPLIGRIAAGAPILAEQNREATFRIDAAMLGASAKANDVFVLKVHGESMIGDGIHHGDLIFVQRADSAREGEIIAALVDGEATVKRFHREGGVITLQPSNPTMEPIRVSESDGRDVRVIGKVIGVFRQM